MRASLCLMTDYRRRITVLISLLMALCSLPAAARPAAPPSSALPHTATLSDWIAEIKDSPKGPFQAIRWFCEDGTLQPPKAYACAGHGGSGVQHGAQFAGAAGLEGQTQTRKLTRTDLQTQRPAPLEGGHRPGYDDLGAQ